MAWRIATLAMAAATTAVAGGTPSVENDARSMIVAAEAMEEAGRYADPNVAKLYAAAAEHGSAQAHWEMAVQSTLGWTADWDEEKALVHLYFASSGNHTMAQMALGFRHMHGLGVPKSCATAVLYYSEPAKSVVERSAVPGNVKRVERFRIDTGDGRKMVDRQEEVVEYYRYSADLGDTAAQLVIGYLLNEGGAGFEKDRKKAFEYFRKAAEKGEPDAVAQLGHMYANGFGVDKDLDKAIQLFQEAINDGSASGSYGLGYMYLAGEGVELDHSRAYQNFKVAADKKHLESHFHLGVLHLLGQGCRKDTAKALRYFNIAAQHGHTLSMYNLAMMYLKGHGTAPSCNSALSILKSVAEQGEVSEALATGYKSFNNRHFDKAMVWYSRAALAGFELAQINLAWLLAQKKRTKITAKWKKDDFEREALKFHHLAALQGNVASLLETGDSFYYGKGVEQNIHKSLEVYMQAGKSNHPQALFNLGIMYEHAIGVDKDFHMAKRYYDMSAHASEEAAVPVKLALAKLWIHMNIVPYFGNWTGIFGQKGALEVAEVPLRAKYASKVAERFFIQDADTFIMAILAVVLVALLLERARRRTLVAGNPAR